MEVGAQVYAPTALPQVFIEQEAGTAPSDSGCGSEEKNSLSLPRIEPCRSSHSLVTTLTELPWLIL
jgi:hypothetical protein